jgi:hypothetical protein
MRWASRCLGALKWMARRDLTDEMGIPGELNAQDVLDGLRGRGACEGGRG